MKKLITALSLIALSGVNNANAQPWTYVPPVNGDIFLHTSPYHVESVNCAMIKYQTPMAPFGRLSAVVDDGNGGGAGVNSSIQIFDDALGGSSWSIMQGGPAKQDVIIGNDQTFPLSRYWVLVAYEVPTVPSSVNIDYYQVDYTGPFTFNVTGPVYTTVIPKAFRPHIDVIAEGSATAITGYPFCRNFVVTWDDGNGNVYGEMATIAIPPATMTPMSAQLISNHGQWPDVAAIYQDIPGCGAPCGQNVALFTYVASGGTYITGGNRLYYNTYNFSTSTPGAEIVKDAVGAGDGIRKPRIDALDYTYPTPGFWTSPFAHYKIAAEVINSAIGFKEIRTYDDLIAGFWKSSDVVDATAISASYGPAPYDHYDPTVAVNYNIFPGYAPDVNYAVAHGTYVGAIDGFIFVEPIDMALSTDLDVNPWTLNKEYHQVNQTAPLNVIIGQLPNGISSTHNNLEDGELMNAWASQLSSSSNDIYYKLSTPAMGTSIYNYRPASGGVSGVNQSKVEVYPNPATNNIVVSAGEKANRYDITDMLGRIVKKGTLHNNENKIDINDLASGTYIMNVYDHNASLDHVKFSKK